MGPILINSVVEVNQESSDVIRLLDCLNLVLKYERSIRDKLVKKLHKIK